MSRNCTSIYRLLFLQFGPLFFDILTSFQSSSSPTLLVSLLSLPTFLPPHI